MRLLLANLVCAAGNEYFASAQDYVLFPVVEESGMNAKCRLEEEVSESNFCVEPSYPVTSRFPACIKLT